MPIKGEEEEIAIHARRIAAINSCAGNDFNRGLRAYYFGMAIMSWMVSAWFFIASTLLIIVCVLAHREFFSPALKALADLNDQ